MDQNHTKELYRRYLSGELNEQELAEFAHLMAKGEFQELMPDIDEVADQYPVNWDDAAHIGAQIIQEKSIRKNRRRLLWNAAAVITGFLILFTGYRSYTDYTDYQKTQHYHIVKVPLGKMIEVTLADGTLVRLASGSVFKYPEAFGKVERRVYLLEGRGFFEVFKNKKKPFTVQSHALATTALGTSFTVENYKNYQFEKVSLYSGKVRVNQGHTIAPVFLVPGQQYALNNHKGEKKDFKNMAKPLENGLLNFEDTKLTEAIYSISSYYHIDIRFNPAKFKNELISGTFKDQSPEQVLKTMSHLYKFKVQHTNSTTYSIIPMKH